MFMSCSDSDIMQLKIGLFIAICVVGFSLGEDWERRNQDRRDYHPDGFGCTYGDRCCNRCCHRLYYKDLVYSETGGFYRYRCEWVK